QKHLAPGRKGAEAEKKQAGVYFESLRLGVSARDCLFLYRFASAVERAGGRNCHALIHNALRAYIDTKIVLDIMSLFGLCFLPGYTLSHLGIDTCTISGKGPGGCPGGSTDGLYR